MVGVTDLLARAQAAGLRLRMDDDGSIKAAGPKACEAIVGELREHRAELVAILNGTACCRCGTAGSPDHPLVATYWTEWQQALCRGCVRMVVAQFERHGWPAVEGLGG